MVHFYERNRWLASTRVGQKSFEFEIYSRFTSMSSDFGEIFTIDILRHRQVEPKIVLVLIPMVARNRAFRNIRGTYQLK